MIKFEIGDVHWDGDERYLHAFLQADTIADIVKLGMRSHSSHGCTIYKVDWSKCKRVKVTYGMTRGTPLMPRVLERIGPYYEQPAAVDAGFEPLTQEAG